MPKTLPRAKANMRSRTQPLTPRWLRREAVFLAKVHVTEARAATMTAILAIESKSGFESVALLLRTSVIRPIDQIDFKAMGGSHG